MIPRLHTDSFDWITWRGGRLADLGIPCREEALITSAEILKKHIVGYLEGERLTCRPKAGHTAIMLLKNDEFFWFHLRNIEFQRIFKEVL